MSSPSKLEFCAKCGAELTMEGVCVACMIEDVLTPALEHGTRENEANQGNMSRGDIIPLPPSFGDYELLEEIARGGMGVVYKARQISLNRIVALKRILRGPLAQEAELRRFRVEAEMAACLQHPNIVATYEVGEQDGQPFFAMEYVEGRSLAEKAHNEPLPAKGAANYLKTIAEAVQYAHSRGVLHRDLKPSNILIDQNDQPRITDFGLAKRFDSTLDSGLKTLDLTLTGQVLGSPNFMPPEQAAGERGAIGPASDVYSLGAVLYQLLTGRPPFSAPTLTQTLRLVAETEPVLPRLLNPTVPRDLETICLKCLQKDVHRRYATAQAMAADLGLYLRDKPIYARPAGPSERLWRWCRRNPALAGSGAAILLLLLTVAIVSTMAAARLQASNRAGKEALRESLLSQARAGRWSGRVGQRFDGLAALKKAAEIRPSPEMRNEAIACLALVDMRPVKILENLPEIVLTLDPTYSRYVRGDTNGDFIIRRLRDNAELARFPGAPASPYGPYFSPSGRYLAINRLDGTNRPLQICDLERHEVVFTVPDSVVRDLDFSPDERFVYVAQGGAPALLRFSIPSGESRELRQLSEVPSAARLNPAGDLLAVSSTESGKVLVLNPITGDVLFPLPHSGVVFGLRWHPDGRLLATACSDRKIYLWDTVKRSSFHVIEGHDGAVTSVSFSRSGELLASGGWDGSARLWNVWTGRQILSQPSSGWLDHFSIDDHLLALPQGSSKEICEVAGGGEWRGFYLTKNAGPAGGACGWSPDGRLLASADRDGSRLWDTYTGREIGLLPSDDGEPWFISFDPSGSNVVATTGGGLRCWPVRWTRRESGDTLLLGPIASVGKALKTGGGLFFNEQGNRLVAEIGGAIQVFDWPSRRPLRTLPLNPGVFGFRLSPSGRLCVGWPGADLPRRVWDVNTGAVLKDLPGYCGRGAAFSPDDHLLVTGGTVEYQAWDTQSWTNLWKLRRPNSSQNGHIALNRAGTMGALTHSAKTIRLFEPATGREFATLEAPDQQDIAWLAFDPEGSRLTATTTANVVHMWDLRLIRKELAALKLDWDAPPFPAAERGKPKPIEVMISSGSNAVPAAAHVPIR